VKIAQGGFPAGFPSMPIVFTKLPVHPSKEWTPPAHQFIHVDETAATLWRANGYVVSNSANNKQQVVKETKKRKRKPEYVVHNDGYNWIKYGQKVIFTP